MDEASVVQLAMRSYAVLSMREDFRLPLLNNGSVRLLGEFLRQPPGGPAARNRTAMLDAYASALVALYNVSLQPECQVGACRLAAPELYIALKWTAKMAQYPPKEGSADLCHTVKSWEDTSLTVFKHVPGCQFCLSLYEHVTLPNGEVVHVYNKKHPQNKTEAVELLKPDVGLLAESGHGSLAAEKSR
eukprot:gene9874-11694_t